MNRASIPTACESCGAPLHAHNLTGLCAECKLIARSKRMSPSYDDTGQVSCDEAIANVTTFLGGRIIFEGEQLA
jgi:hypothetical protein